MKVRPELARGSSAIHSVQPLLLWRIGSLRGRAMNGNRITSAAAQERFVLASECLITLRHLAQRYFKEADRHQDE